MFYVLCSRYCLFFVFKGSFEDNFCTGLNLHLVSELFQLQGDIFAVEGVLLGPEVDPVSGRSTRSILAVKENGEQREDRDQEI